MAMAMAIAMARDNSEAASLAFPTRSNVLTLRPKAACCRRGSEQYQPMNSSMA